MRTKLPLLLTLLLLLVACRQQQGPLPPQGEPAAQARVTVTGTGLFKVEPRALSELGWTTEMPLTLSLNDQEIPYQAAQDGALYFYLPDSVPARYSPQHTLWLSYGVAADAAAAPDDATALDTLQAEQRLTGSEQYSAHHVGDPWFWRTLAAPAMESYPVQTPGRQAGPVTVTVRVAGVTQVEHKLALRVGESEAGTLMWNGQARHEETFTVNQPAGEELSLTFEVPESTAGFDMSMLDEVVVHYPSQPLAVEGTFRGFTEKGGTATFDKLGRDAIAWQLEPEIVPLQVEATDGGVKVWLPAAQPVIVSERRLAQPATVARYEASALPTKGADYVAVVAPELAEAAEALLAFHREEGLSVLALAPQQVYDAYTGGTVDPLAFRALLAEAQETWETKPRFLLLVGDSTYDPDGNQNELPPAYLPSPFIETVYGGETVSDNLIADTDEDGYPDIALGRLPARSVEQLTTMVRKIVAYNQTPAEGAWQQRVLFAADGRERIFKDNSEQLRGELAAAYEGATLYPEAEAGAMEQIVPALNEGNLIVNYVGHGSVQQWGRDRLLTAEAASELSNGARLPIMINMTCLTGLFSHPSQESLAEAMLWAKNGGAIAAVAPSSLTLPTNQSPLNRALLAELLSDERPTVGEALMRAKKSVPLGNPNDHDIIATFNLLGDPALRLVGP